MLIEQRKSKVRIKIKSTPPQSLAATSISPALRAREEARATAKSERKKSPAVRGFFHRAKEPPYITSGSLNASISPAKSLIGMQLQNTFLSPCTLSTRATGGQYFCSFNVASGNAASSRG